MDDLANVKDKLSLSRNYHDVKGLDNLRKAAQSGDTAAIKEAASQFEAIFVQMMLKSMRKAQDAMADKDSPFNSEQVKFYRDMHDQQLAVDLSANGNMGLADLIVQQLSPQTEGVTPASVIRNDGNLSGINRHTRAMVSRAQEAVVPAGRQAAFDSIESFVATLLPAAQEAAQQLGIEPRALVAQAAVETGWGQHMIHDGKGQNTHNLFGIKASRDWQGDKTAINTVEFDGDVARSEQAAFRHYGSFGEALQDYVDFVKGHPRYQAALQQATDPKAYFNELQRAGYATDPSYADKVMAVFNSDALQGAGIAGEDAW
ncbi:flagellar assembly peptidoglycan hydrolase FlgJ [Aestuariibacter halophilus]|uniref:Peptidoglycan hydrolase FlgJ n=1 Tax=Fluctibacter halophilus TaxID=226011 RepID=A0ABS8G5E2_9ALTE|nr:flagellar assembly peptidoglycan hydrolase FlgJ [Aestuariibacter halophilus]MCC2615090.1 flagellar assembly peptidoglycan hydrolase FlgJ [Aestuariibacter halophilus]